MFHVKLLKYILYETGENTYITCVFTIDYYRVATSAKMSGIRVESGKSGIREKSGESLELAKSLEILKLS